MTKDEIKQALSSGAFAGDRKFEILLTLLLEIADELKLRNDIATFSLDEVRGS